MEDVPKHHVKQEYCETRPSYRKGRKKTSVRVFTVNTESRFLIVTEIPSPSLESDLVKLFSSFGTLNHARQLTDYPQEEFVKTYLMEFQDIQAAKTAKKFTDEKYFYGGMLHVFYAPEYESVADVRDKILHRRQSVTVRVKVLEKETKRLNRVKNGPNSKKSKVANTNKAQAADNFNQNHNANLSTNNDLSSDAVDDNTQIYETTPKNAIPCNKFGIPLFLPPPPPPLPNPYPPEPISQHDVPLTTKLEQYDRSHPLSDKLRIVSKTIDKKKSCFKARKGYFHEKAVAAIQASRTNMATTSTDTNIGLHVSKINANFKPPPFVPRHVEMKSMDGVGKTSKS